MEKINKLLSIILSLTIILSVTTILPSSIVANAEGGNNFSAQHIDVDFTKYAKPTTAADGMNSNLLGISDTEDATQIAWTLPSEENGNKYLKFEADGGTGKRGNGYGYYLFTPNASGAIPYSSTKENASAYTLQLESNSTYRVSFDYRLFTEGTAKSVKIRMSYITSARGAAYNLSGRTHLKTTEALAVSVAENMNWNNYSLEFTTGDLSADAFNTFTMFIDIGSGLDIALGKGNNYTLDLDNIQVDRIGTATVNFIQNDLAVGEAKQISFAPASTWARHLFSSTSGDFAGGVFDEATKSYVNIASAFAATDYVDNGISASAEFLGLYDTANAAEQLTAIPAKNNAVYYAKYAVEEETEDNSFAAQHIDVDFTKYAKPTTAADGMNSNLLGISDTEDATQIAWTLPSEENGNKYLKYEAVGGTKNRGNGYGFQLFTPNASGAIPYSSTKELASAYTLQLQSNSTYRVSFDYRLFTEGTAKSVKIRMSYLTTTRGATYGPSRKDLKNTDALTVSAAENIDWNNYSLEFTTGDLSADNFATFTMFIDIGSSIAPVLGKGNNYTLDLDNIQVDRIGTATVNFIQNDLTVGEAKQISFAPASTWSKHLFSSTSGDFAGGVFNEATQKYVNINSAFAAANYVDNGIAVNAGFDGLYSTASAVEPLNEIPAKDGATYYAIYTADTEVEGAPFTAQHLDVDFEKFDFEATADEGGLNGKHAFNDTDYGVTWSKGEEGDNTYLKYTLEGKDHTDRSNNYIANTFIPNSTGHHYSNAEREIELEANAKYRVSYRYKLKTTDVNNVGDTVVTPKFQLQFVALHTNRYNNFGLSAGQICRSDDWDTDVLEDTDEWKEMTFCFTTDHEFLGTDQEEPLENSYFAIVMKVDYLMSIYTGFDKIEFAIDDIQLDRVGTVNVVYKNGRGDEYDVATDVEFAPHCEYNKDLFSAASGDYFGGVFNATNDKLEQLSAMSRTEVYKEDATGYVLGNKLYSDDALTAELTQLPAVSGLDYYRAVELTDENQKAFLGFDKEPKIRAENADYGITHEWNTFTDSLSKAVVNGINHFGITDAAANTGYKSLHYTTGAPEITNRRYYIGNSFEYEKNKDYVISFYIKTDSESTEPFNIDFISAGSFYQHSELPERETVSITPSGEWTKYSVNFKFTEDKIVTGRQPQYYYAPCMEVSEAAPSFYIDTLTISEVPYDVIMNGDAERTEDGKSVRFKTNYLESRTYPFGGQNFEVVERGTLIKSSVNPVRLVYANKELSDVLCVSKTTNLDNEYYANSEGYTTFSAVVDRLTNDGREITAKGYIKFADGTIIYSDEVTYCDTPNKSYIPEGYSLKWGDEFDGNCLSSNWTVKKEYDENGILKTDGLDSTTQTENEANQKIVNGNLRLKTYLDENDQYCLPWGIYTEETMNFKFGYLEFRAKIPFKQGSWSSVWSTSSAHKDPKTFVSSSTPREGINGFSEIDFIETKGDYSSFNLHRWEKRDENAEKEEDFQVDGFESIQDTEQFTDPYVYRTFGFLWEESGIKMYIDGQLYREYNFADATFGSAGKGIGQINDYQYLNIDCGLYTSEYATDKDWAKNYVIQNDDTLPFDFVIDYVRIYQNDNQELNTK